MLDVVLISLPHFGHFIIPFLDPNFLDLWITILITLFWVSVFQCHSNGDTPEIYLNLTK